MSNYVPPTTPIGGPAGQPFPPQQSFPPPPPQKKSKVWVWVLAGCGTFIVIGVIAVFLGGYFVWNKAKEIIKDKGGSIPFEVLKGLLLKLASSLVGLG